MTCVGSQRLPRPAEEVADGSRSLAEIEADLSRLVGPPPAPLTEPLTQVPARNVYGQRLVRRRQRALSDEFEAQGYPPFSRNGAWQQAEEAVWAEIQACMAKGKWPHRGCRHCGRVFYYWPRWRYGDQFGGDDVAATYCRPRCAVAAGNARAGERRRLARQGKACTVCGQPLTVARADARTCNARCRQAARRSRLANVTAPSNLPSVT